MSHVARRIRLRRAADIELRSISWLWPGRVPLGKVTLIAGDPGMGKSFLTAYLAATVSRGSDFPDGPPGLRKPGSVVMLSGEDDASDTLRPRLEAHGADLSRIHIAEGVVREAAPTGSDVIDLDRHMEELESAVREVDRCRLLVVDPIAAFLGTVDDSSNGQVRRLLRALADLAARHGPAVVCVSHMNKNVQGKAIYRTMGSLAFIAAARAAYYVTQSPGDEDERIMAPIKANVDLRRTAMSFRIEEGRVAWGRTDLNITADEMDAEHRGEKRDQFDEALQFLRAVLADGARPAADVIAQGEQAGIGAATLRRAKKSLGIVSRKHGAGEHAWCWMLPGKENESMFTFVEPAHTDAAQTHGEGRCAHA